MDLAEMLSEVQEQGYTSNFACHGDGLRCTGSGEEFAAGEAWIVDSRSVDQGTDPGDDATIYLVETQSGRRGYLIVGDSFHTDPHSARFIDSLARER